MGDRYGCHNTDRQSHYWARDTSYATDPLMQPHESWRRIENTMSRECRYDMRDTDKRCEGCGK